MGCFAVCYVQLSQCDGPPAPYAMSYTSVQGPSSDLLCARCIPHAGLELFLCSAGTIPVAEEASLGCCAALLVQFCTGPLKGAAQWPSDRMATVTPREAWKCPKKGGHPEKERCREAARQQGSGGARGREAERQSSKAERQSDREAERGASCTCLTVISIVCKVKQIRSIRRRSE